MTGKVSFALLLLVAFCWAEDVEVDVKEDIEKAKAQVTNMSQSSTKTVEDINVKLTEISSYFNSSISKYQMEGELVYNNTGAALKNLTNKFVGDAIDKNKPVNTFKCILRVRTETEKTIVDSRKTTVNCIEGVLNKYYSEMTNLRIQLALIQEATVGLYDSILKRLEACTTSSCVVQLLHEAEVRENNLRKLVQAYVERGSDLRIQYNEGQMACLRSAQGSSTSTLNICANKMKAC